ncbi:tryptophan synthase subunit alpha [Legionella londiniensis]|uniref:Tryptophan synthase alpha chain n=1 Tax=Legionella londiniensis TaxID=45068 RepID=A0A0W0VNP1_9GAMM|nr:tryptophan synthase subunit alpha [Legionella londiniensis]KTD21549.1 tryptophan synthase subunit alpha [Legionella londiniensis]STX92774.1 tryptophan synthase alpha chain [Legionella londiniensis]
MNRIDQKIHELHSQGKKLLSPYITAGDPDPKMTVHLMHALVGAGADILEIGIPFSDPMAEGPVIQAAMERALQHGVHCDDVLSMVAEFRKQDNQTPVVLMGYLNPVEQYGYEAFAKRAKASGVDGTILVDLPPEESAEISRIWEENDLCGIYLCSPTTEASRLKLIDARGRGYVYFVSLKGVTGADMLDLASVKNHYLRCKEQIHLPMLVGFGIKTPEMAAEIASFADGVIVGAALINQIFTAYRENKDAAKIAAQLINNMRVAMQ